MAGRKKGDDDLRAPDEKDVLALEELGWKADKVRRWTSTRARLTLAQAQKDQAIATRRAIAKAKEEGIKFDGAAKPRGLPTPIERLEAAAYLAEPMNADDLAGAVSMSICFLTDSETKRLAGYLVRLLAADGGFSADHIAQAVGEAGGSGGDDPGEPDHGPAGDDPGPGPEGGSERTPAALPNFEG